MANLYDPIYEYKSNPYYIEFIKEKELLKQNYPPHLFHIEGTSGRAKKYIKKLNQEYIDSGDRNLHQQYLKELLDLIFKPDGNYQQFTWDIMGEVEKLEMERIARGRYSSEYTDFE